MKNISLLLYAFLSLSHAKDDSDRLLKLAKKTPDAYAPTCAPNRDSLAKAFIAKHEWDAGQAEAEFSTNQKFAAQAGELEIASLNSGNSLPGLEYAYFLLWPKPKGACAAEIRFVPPSSNDARSGIGEIGISATPAQDVYQIEVTAQKETLDPNAANPDATLRQTLSKDVSLVRFSKGGEVKFLAAEIPVYDSGDGTRKKSKPRELTVKLDANGNLGIAAGSAAPGKNQKPWIGQYHLTVSSQPPAPQSGKPESASMVDAAYKTALALFKAGKPGPAADTLCKVLPPGAPLTPATLPIANDLGFFLTEAKRYSEGAKVLETVVAADPDRTVAYLNLGDAYAGMGKEAEAKAQYRKYADRMTKDGKAAKIPARIKSILSK